MNVEAIANGLRLAGSQDANVPDSVIDYVETTLRLTNSETGTNAAVYAFTGTDVGPFTDIQDGQIIQVEVEITFDTPAP